MRSAHALGDRAALDAMAPALALRQRRHVTGASRRPDLHLGHVRHLHESPIFHAVHLPPEALLA